jgi:hypothetical protein
LRLTCVSTYPNFGVRCLRIRPLLHSSATIAFPLSITLSLFLKRTRETDRTPDKRRQVDSSFVCFRSQALELTGFGIDRALNCQHSKDRQGMNGDPDDSIPLRVLLYIKVYTADA